mmetsp:Transcript_14564/g.40218  ORF Transcript_14564/g.40218 Transcript_14564/m.40218 type:complete len:213 (-) Transcript_14564:189-827(-)
MGTITSARKLVSTVTCEPAAPHPSPGPAQPYQCWRYATSQNGTAAFLPPLAGGLGTGGAGFGAAGFAEPGCAAAAGVAGPAAVVAGFGAAGATASTAAAAGAAGVAAAFAGAAPGGGAAPPAFMVANTWPTSTVSSALARSSSSMPFSSAFTSTLTLSVSMTARTSPLAQKSPTFFCHSMRVPSVMLSAPKSGVLICSVPAARHRLWLKSPG